MMRHLRFSLRLLFVVTTLTAILIGYLCNQARKQSFSKKRILELGGSVFYAHDPEMASMRQRQWWISEKIADVLGVDFVFSLTTVIWYPPPNVTDDNYNAMIDAICGLPSLKHIVIRPEASVGLTYLSDQLQTDGGISDAGIAYLQKRIHSLELLNLTSAKVTNSGLQSLVDDRRVEIVRVSRHIAYGNDRPIDMVRDRNGKVHHFGNQTVRIPEWRSPMDESKQSP